LQQSKPRRSFKGQGSDDVGMDKFYEIMGEFYSSDMKKHASPTKRLIQQKDAAFKHKEFLSRKITATQDYQLTYVASPQKTYVIEPKGGEINYDLAFKNPLKFYDNVMNQDIREHSATAKGRKSPLKYSNILTKRAIAKVLNAIERKLNKLIRQQTFEQFKSNNENINEAEFDEAMQDWEMEAALKRQLTDGGIKLLHKDSGSPVFVKETKLIGEKGKNAAEEVDENLEVDLEAEPDEAELVSGNIFD